MIRGFEAVSPARRQELAEIAVGLALEVEESMGAAAAEGCWRQAAEFDPSTALRALRRLKRQEVDVELTGGALLDRWCFENDRSSPWLARQLDPQPNPSTVSRWRNGSPISERYAEQLARITGLTFEALIEPAAVSGVRRAG